MVSITLDDLWQKCWSIDQISYHCRFSKIRMLRYSTRGARRSQRASCAFSDKRKHLLSTFKLTRFLKLVWILFNNKLGNTCCRYWCKLILQSYLKRTLAYLLELALSSSLRMALAGLWKGSSSHPLCIISIISYFENTLTLSTCIYIFIENTHTC